MRNRSRLIVRGSNRARCPVCRNEVTYPFASRGADVTDQEVPVHSEGLIGSGIRCYASGRLGTDALELGDALNQDPSFPLRAHP